MPEKSSTCTKGMSEIECQKAILEKVADDFEAREGNAFAQSKKMRKIIKLVEHFIRENKLLCYGGTAINNILPSHAQFYDRKHEVPDYDFFSPNALEDAKKLADVYHENGFTYIEAKSGMHHGTYKVFVDFVPVADITHMSTRLYEQLVKDAVVIDDIHYAPPNFLRMSMYLELSRPKGMVSRWPKVFERLQLLNKYYPIVGHKRKSGANASCDVNLRKMMENEDHSDKDVLNTIMHIFLDEKVVFFGGMANALYLKNAREKNTKKDTKQIDITSIPSFDVLSLDAKKLVFKTKEILQEHGHDHVNVQKRPNIDEVIPLHYEIRIKDDVLARVFYPIACHAYNTVKFRGSNKIRVATINTILSFYLAFIYVDRPFFDQKNLLCMAHILFEFQQERSMQEGKGLFRQYSYNCYGKQEQLPDIMKKKTNKYLQLKNKKNTQQYDEWFLNYKPSS